MPLDDNTDRAAALRELKRRGELDTETGAPAGVRAVVGGAMQAEDKLSTLRSFYPDAFRDPIDPDNFVFTNPETGKYTTYNPRGLDTGDVASVAREGSQTVFGTMGSAYGAVVGLATGSPFAGAVVGSMAGTQIGDKVYNLVARRLGMKDTRSIPQWLRDEAILTAGGAMGPGGGAAAGYGVRAGTKKVFRGGTPINEVRQAVSDSARWGGVPSVATATKNAALDGIESNLAGFPGAAGKFRSVVDTTLTKIQQRIEGKATTLTGKATPDPEFAGRAVSSAITREPMPGIPGGFISRFTDRGENLYGKLYQFIPKEKQIRLDNFKTALGEIGRPLPELPEVQSILATATTRKLSGALSKDTHEITGMRFDIVQRLRSLIGKNINKSALLEGIPSDEAKKLYAALSEDIRVAAEATAGGSRAFRNANNYWRAGRDRIDNILSPAIKNKVPERIFETLETSAKHGPSVIRTMRRSMEPGEWEVVAGTMVRRMGLARPSVQGVEGGAFSLDTFLTNWNHYKKAGKSLDEIFEGSPTLRGMRADFDALARWAERTKESSRAFYNPAGTAAAGTGRLMLFGSLGSVGLMPVMGWEAAAMFPIITATSAIASNRLAALMLSPSFVKWLAAGTRIKPKGVGAHIGRLASISVNSDEESRKGIQELLGLLSEGSKPKP